MEKIVASTLQAAWARFGAEALDEATREYITGIACSVLGEVTDAEAGEKELLEQLLPLLEAQELTEKQSQTLCKAMARAAFPEKAKAKADSSKKSGKQAGENVMCLVKNLILMYMGGSKLLLKDTTLELLKGHRYGIVGNNGAGKTTLMDRIASGGVQELVKTGLVFMHIRHETLNAREDIVLPAIDFARKVVGEDAPVHSALDEVGFSEELRRKPVRELSGGWRMRLLLATAVARSADVLLLDEPTNHLDVHAITWLVQYLTSAKQKDATSMIVSHDANFLNRVCTDIIHFDDRQLKYYEGNFANFQEQASINDEETVKAVLQVRSTMGDVDESSTPSAPAKPADGAVSSSAGAISSPSPSDDGAFRMTFPIPGKVDGLTSNKKAVIDIKDAWFKYPLASSFALRGVSTRITMNSRVAMVGPNGAGKSTLMSMLCGEIRPTENDKGTTGDVIRHRNLRLAYIAQDHMFHLGEYSKCTASEYIQLRFKKGYDEELQKRLNNAATPEELRTRIMLAEKFGKYGRKVEALVSRVKKKSTWHYEVAWEGLGEKQNTFEPLSKLRQMGVERMATALDERIAAANIGNDERPLTRREIVKHFENFGLSEDLVTLRAISTYSGGQKSKLMIGAAFWIKPHVVCLDEPTNFLDFETVAALQRALKQFRGGVAVVSHNEEFLSGICDEIWSVENHVVTVVKNTAAPAEREEKEEGT